ncbi:MAG: hypothetical protein Kow0040_01930 [Thermogutta sp.]
MIDLSAIFETEPAVSTTATVATTPRNGVNTAGVRLLRRLWRAGYTLELVRNPAAACGFVLIPRGQVEPTAELLDMYERHHDEAAAALVETCRLAGTQPENWHLKAAEIVALNRPATSPT